VVNAKLKKAGLGGMTKTALLMRKPKENPRAGTVRMKKEREGGTSKRACRSLSIRRGGGTGKRRAKHPVEKVLLQEGKEKRSPIGGYHGGSEAWRNFMIWSGGRGSLKG